MKTKALIDWYNDEGNVGGDPTDIFKLIIKTGTMSKNGDKLFLHYVIQNTLESNGSAKFYFNGSLILDGIVNNNINEIDIIIMRTNPGSVKIIVTDALGQLTTYYTSSADFVSSSDIETFWRIEDQSGGPANNTIVGLMGTAIFVSASDR